MDKDLAIKIFEQWVCDYGCDNCPRKDDPLSNCIGQYRAHKEVGGCNDKWCYWP